jgi:hypothetical protein
MKQKVRFNEPKDEKIIKKLEESNGKKVKITFENLIVKDKTTGKLKIVREIKDVVVYE